MSTLPGTGLAKALQASKEKYEAARAVAMSEPTNSFDERPSYHGKSFSVPSSQSSSNGFQLFGKQASQAALDSKEPANKSGETETCKHSGLRIRDRQVSAAQLDEYCEL
jgi:hypothetical protein